jgi:hypothetical protein
MKNLENLKEQLVRQAILMSYDTSKTLSENEIPTLAGLDVMSKKLQKGLYCKTGYVEVRASELSSLLEKNPKISLPENLKKSLKDSSFISKLTQKNYNVNFAGISFGNDFYKPYTASNDFTSDTIICVKESSDFIESYIGSINSLRLDKSISDKEKEEKNILLKKTGCQKTRKEALYGEKDSKTSNKGFGKWGDCPGRDAFETINLEIKGSGSLFSSWGTDEDRILDALNSLKTKEDYENLLFWIYKSYPEFRGATVTQWIQTNEFSKASESSRYEASGLGGLSVKNIGSNIIGNWFQDTFNDDYLKIIEKTLKRFNSGEKFDFESTFNDSDEFSAGFKTAIPPFTREALHTVLPLVSLAAMLVPGGQGVGSYLIELNTARLISFGAEVLDAAIYKYVDKDEYMAGLSLIFAIAGPLYDQLGLLVKSAGKSLLIKLAKGTKQLTDKEIELLTFTTSNMVKISKLTKIGMRMNEVAKLIMRIKTMPQLYMVTSWLVKKNLIPLKFIKDAGLMVGGSFLSWESINEKFFKYCNTMPLKNLQKSETWILQKIGDLGATLQPYSVPCEETMVKNAKAKAIEQNNSMSERLKSSFKELSKGSNSFSLKNKGSKLPEVIFMQTFLQHLGFSFIIPDQKKVDKEVEKGVKWSKEKCKSEYEKMLLGGADMYKMSQHPECKQYLEPNKKTSDERWKFLNTKVVKKDEKPTKEYGSIEGLFKWGFYDEFTESMVKEFQKKYGLKADGVCGPNTFEKMLDILNRLGSNVVIKNYSGIVMTANEIKKLREEASKILDNEVKNMDKQTKELVKSMNQSKFEESKERAIEAATKDAEKLENTNINWSSSGTKEINELNPDKLFDSEIPKTDTLLFSK